MTSIILPEYKSVIDAFISSNKNTDNECSIAVDAQKSKERSQIYDYLRLNNLKHRTIIDSNKKIIYFKHDIENNDQKTITNNDLQIFIKYTGLPISVVDVDFIDIYIDRLDKYFNSKTIYELFKKEFQIFDFSSEFFKVTNEIMDDIRKSKEYIDFINAVANKKKNPFKKNIQIIKSDIYSSNNVGKKYLSIDIKQANFTIFKQQCPNMFPNGIWETFIGKYTKSQFIIKSKYLREYIFGKLDIMTDLKQLQEELIEKIHVQLCKDFNNLFETAIKMKVGDEIIYQIDDFDNINIDDINRSIHKIGNFFHVSTFELSNINNKPYFIKNYIYHSNNKSIDLKCIPKKFILQAIKKVENKDVDDIDLMFMDESVLAKYIKSIF